MSSRDNDNFTHTIQWGSTAGDNYHIHQDGQLNHEANKIFYDGDWKTIAPAEHNHNNNVPSYFTYNDDSVRMDRIIDVIDEMLAALGPVIDVGDMKKISDKLVKLRNTTGGNNWMTYNDASCLKVKEEEPKIELEEDLFEL